MCYCFKWLSKPWALVIIGSWFKWESIKPPQQIPWRGQGSQVQRVETQGETDGLPELRRQRWEPQLSGRLKFTRQPGLQRPAEPLLNMGECLPMHACKKMTKASGRITKGSQAKVCRHSQGWAEYLLPTGRTDTFMAQRTELRAPDPQTREQTSYLKADLRFQLDSHCMKS